MALAESWHIKSRAHECAATSKPFAEGESFYTALFPDPESDGYLREDFSEEAWEARPHDATPPFSFWKTVYVPPEQEAKVEIVEKENPESLLSRLVEEDEEHTENARYILAVMLERKKVLVETDSQQTKTGLLRIYENRHSGEVFIVKDPQIPLSEIGPIQEEVQALLAPKEEPEPDDSGDPATDDSEESSDQPAGDDGDTPSAEEEE